jgi:hypothetical protein
LVTIATNRMSPIRAALGAFLIFAASIPGVASAAPSAADKAAAQALFDGALTLMSGKHFEEARQKLEESERLDPALGTRYQLAQCYEALGRAASAWAAFLEVADLARATGQEAREKAARDRAAQVEPKVDRLVVEVAPPTPSGLEVRRDDVILGPAQWGTAIPVDPGVYRVTATAPSRIPWSSEVAVTGTGQAFHVRVPVSAEVVPLANTAMVPAPPPAGVAPPRLRVSPGSTERTTGIVVASAGAAAMIAGTVLGVIAHSNYESAGTHCGAAGCDATGKSITDAARRLGNVGTGVFAGGAAIAVTGGVLWFVGWRATKAALHEDDRPRPPSASLSVGPGALMLSGSF